MPQIEDADFTLKIKARLALAKTELYGIQSLDIRGTFIFL